MGRGFSMLELLVGVVIFSFAMLPLISFSTSSTRGSYNVGKHLMAGQVASGLLDQLLAQPYDESLKLAQELEKKGKAKLMDDPMLLEVLKQLKDAAVRGEMEKDLKRAFQFFRYEVKVDEASDASEKGQMFLITVKVYWRIQEGAKDEQSLMLSSIKFQENL